MAYNTFEGSKYNKDHSREERKAAILAHLKTLVPAGARVTLREGRGTGTMSLDATVANLPFAILDASFIKTAVVGGHLGGGSRYTEEAAALLKLLEVEAEEFGFDHSEIESDYFSRAFYFHPNFNAAEENAEREAIICGASPKRAAVHAAISSAIAVYGDFTEEAGKRVELSYWGDAAFTAAKIDKAMGTNHIAAIAALNAVAEDWSDAAGLAAQAAFVAAKKVPAKAAKVPVAKKLTAKQIDKRVERAYYYRCGGVTINVLDIPKVFAEGRKIVEAGATDAELADALGKFVTSIRVDGGRMDTAARDAAVVDAKTPVETKVPASYEAALDSLIAEVRKGPKAAMTDAEAKATLTRVADAASGIATLSPQKRAWITRRAREAAKAVA